jgi:hypothetical protein
MKLSKYFTKEEFEHSNTSVQRSILNVMDSGQTQKAIDLCENVLDKIREYTNKPLKLNCGYRSPLVNKAVGGAKSSQHILGEAADLHIQDKETFDWIKANLEYDQLIKEQPLANGGQSWIHVSYRKGRNRKEVLKMEKKGGKSVYTRI